MSRIGRLPITVPAGVTVTVDGQAVNVKGPKGELSLNVKSPIEVALEDGTLTVTPALDKELEALHEQTMPAMQAFVRHAGLTRNTI